MFGDSVAVGGAVGGLLAGALSSEDEQLCHDDPETHGNVVPSNGTKLVDGKLGKYDSHT